jgi:hypothetical protein
VEPRREPIAQPEHGHPWRWGPRCYEAHLLVGPRRKRREMPTRSSAITKSQVRFQLQLAFVEQGRRAHPETGLIPEQNKAVLPGARDRGRFFAPKRKKQLRVCRRANVPLGTAWSLAPRSRSSQHIRRWRDPRNLRDRLVARCLVAASIRGDTRANDDQDNSGLHLPRGRGPRCRAV